MQTIDNIIEQKPHLASPLSLYKKTRRFEDEVLALCTGSSSPDAGVSGGRQVSYLPEQVKPICELFSSLFEVPIDMLMPLREAMERGSIDFSRLPLNEVPSFLFPYEESEVATLLFLMGRPFFLMQRKRVNLDHLFWHGGKCPVCQGAASLSSLPDDTGRTLICPYCAFRGRWVQSGCPLCQNRDENMIEHIEAVNETGISISACRVCKGYFKTADREPDGHRDADILDIISLPLDIIAQGKRFHRPCPNPLGITAMV